MIKLGTMFPCAICGKTLGGNAWAKGKRLCKRCCAMPEERTAQFEGKTVAEKIKGFFIVGAK